ncbi:MAG: hypothetical protein CL608_18565 [Anaerolineaceae bacterium]|nr:hypothetical protein [Anaerolineaceae bacterium]
MSKKSCKFTLNITEHLQQECDAMAKHALESGSSLSPSIVQTLDKFNRLEPRTHTPEDLEQLTNAHGQLVKIVAPARPETLLLLAAENEQNMLCRTLGPVPLIRQLTVTAVLLLAAFAVMTILGPGKTYDMAYYLISAGLGGTFFGLYKANRYIVANTFDPTYAFSYWIRITLGLIAGLVLATLIFPNGVEGSGTLPLTPALIALLGGFSADVLYRILARLVEVLELLVEGRVPTSSPGEQERLAKAIEALTNKDAAAVAAGK